MPRAESGPIVVYGARAASISLYFDGLPVDLRRRVRFLAPGPLPRDIAILADASLVILARDFRQAEHRGLLAALRVMEIPLAWLLDDDLAALGREDPGMAWYTTERVAAFAGDAAAVVVTSRPLADRFAPLNPRVVAWPCLFDVAWAGPPSPVGAALRIGCFGGAFRRASFQKHVLPAARDLDRARPVELVVTAALVEKPDPPMLTTAPFQLDFAAFVPAWRALALNGVAHPYGETENIANKGPGSVLAASYLGAVPIVADEPAHAGMDETMGVLKAERSEDAWRDAFARLSVPGEAARLFGRLDVWRRESFDPEHARAPFERLEALARPGRSRPGVQIARLRGALAAARRRLSA